MIVQLAVPATKPLTTPVLAFTVQAAGVVLAYTKAMPDAPPVARTAALLVVVTVGAAPNVIVCTVALTAKVRLT